MLAQGESAALAECLICRTLQKQRITPGQLTLHADRGSSMRSKPVALLLADLGVTRTHSRPHTSDNNPFSEAQFKTMKYRPDFPRRFGSREDASAFCRRFFRWYNTEHRYAGIGLVTPEALHTGQASAIVEARQATLLAMYSEHPERFVRKLPEPPAIPKAVWINEPDTNTDRR